MPSIKVPLAACLACLATSTLPPYPSTVIPDQELQQLIALYNSAGGPGWIDAVNWPDPEWGACNWFGVTCVDFQEGPHVVAIELPHNNLTGSLPDTLGWLFHLQRLDVSHNKYAASASQSPRCGLPECFIFIPHTVLPVSLASSVVPV